MIPPKPQSRAGRVSLWKYWKLFRQDILSAQPERLYRAKMAEFRTPFFRSFMINETELIEGVLQGSPEAYPKSRRVTSGLRVLLGQSVFVTNGDQWAAQRRIIDPAFEGGRVREAFPSMVEAAQSALERLEEGDLDVEAWASHVTADVIFRALFSVPIEDELAAETFRAFKTFQREQPVATTSALVPWLPPFHRRATRDAARRLRQAVQELVRRREKEIEADNAPYDLATKIMTTPDPETGKTFSPKEMVDQVMIFFLAGHETSAALLSWAIWLLTASPKWGEAVADEVRVFWEGPDFSELSKMKVTRNVLRETLRLYPPVPMMVREAATDGEMRKRPVRVGDQIVISPWHLHRNDRYWSSPDAFDPSRWDEGGARDAFLPFSQGPRVCPGAGFAMVEATVLLSAFLAHYEAELKDAPIPVAHLTVRSKDGIFLSIQRRS